MPSQCWRSSFKAREVRFFIMYYYYVQKEVYSICDAFSNPFQNSHLVFRCLLPLAPTGLWVDTSCVLQTYS